MSVNEQLTVPITYSFSSDNLIMLVFNFTIQTDKFTASFSSQDTDATGCNAFVNLLNKKYNVASTSSPNFDTCPQQLSVICLSDL